MKTMLIVVLRNQTVSVSRLPKIVDDYVYYPRYHERRYPTRVLALTAYWSIAGRLECQGRLHKASCIES